MDFFKFDKKLKLWKIYNLKINKNGINQIYFTKQNLKA